MANEFPEINPFDGPLETNEENDFPSPQAANSPFEDSLFAEEEEVFPLDRKYGKIMRTAKKLK